MANVNVLIERVVANVNVLVESLCSIVAKKGGTTGPPIAPLPAVATPQLDQRPETEMPRPTRQLAMESDTFVVLCLCNCN